VSQERNTLGQLLGQKHMPALDAIRAVSVFLVVLTHARIAGGGSFGVNTFFVLSGFLITHLLLKEHESSGKISLRDFYLRRSLRIFPAYYVFLAFSLVVDHFAGDPRSQADALASAFYLQNYRNAVVGHSNSSIAHSWSLAVEEQFYLLWPITLMALLRVGGHAAARRFLVVAIAAVMAWRCYAYGWLGLSRFWAYNAFDCRFDSLAMGCLLKLVLREKAARARFDRIAESAIAIPLLIVLLLIPGYLAPAWWQFSVGFTYEAVIVASAIPLLMLRAGHGAWSWMQWRTVTYIGTISYSLYLYHQWGLGLGHKFGFLPHWAQFVVGCAFCVALASASYWFVEKPFLRLKGRFGHKHQSVTLAAHAQQ
jgi:peptidoglycan/LPS O-acetylase OafA/YrhL